MNMGGTLKLSILFAVCAVIVSGFGVDPGKGTSMASIGESEQGVEDTASVEKQDASDSGTYKWIDDKGTIHFSDRPMNPESEHVEVRTINTYRFSEAQPENVDQDKGAHQAESGKPSNQSGKLRSISAADYKFFSSAIQSGDEVVLSGRVSDGPDCKALRLTIRAQSSRGKAIVASTVVNDVGWGSKLYRVVKKATYPKYSAWPTWEVTDVQARCAD